MTDEEFERLAATFGFAPSRPLREMLEAAVKAEREKQGMTHDDIIRMAKEAWGEHHEIFWFNDGGIERFAALVRADEREACARVCEQSDEDGEGPDCWGWHSKDYTAAIRARSKE